MKPESHTLDDILEEYRINLRDFEAALLTLECLNRYGRDETLRKRYPEETLKRAQEMHCRSAEQYMEEIYSLSQFVGKACAGPEGAVFFK